MKIQPVYHPETFEVFNLWFLDKYYLDKFKEIINNPDYMPQRMIFDNYCHQYLVKKWTDTP